MFRHIILLIVSLVFLSVPVLLLPQTVHNKDEARNVMHGLPFEFVGQDLSRDDLCNPELNPCPQQVKFYSPWEYPIALDWSTFILNILMVWVVLSFMTSRANKQESGEVDL